MPHSDPNPRRQSRPPRGFVPGRPAYCYLALAPLLAMLLGILAAVGSSAHAASDHAAPARAEEPFAVRVEPAAPGSDPGSVVLMIPGLGSPSAIWDDTARALAADGHEVHLLGLAGFAGRPPLSNVDSESDAEGSFLLLVRDALLAYVRQLPERPALVGHSLGGTLALWTAATEPGLFGPVVAVDGVAFLPALMNPAATGESMKAQASQLRAMISAMTPEAYHQQTTFTLSTMITSPEEARRVAELSRGSHPPTVGTALFELMTRDLRPALAAIEAPVLLVAAGSLAPGAPPALADQLETRYRQQVAAVPDARVEVVKNARHFVMIDAPDPLLALIRGHLGSDRAGGSPSP